MKRPLACAGLLFLVTQLLAAFLPSAVFGPLTAVFILASISGVKLRGAHRARLLLTCLVPAAALLGRMTADAVWVAPLQRRAGQEAEVRAAVVETRTGYMDEVVQAVVRIERVDGESVRPFYAYCPTLPAMEPGALFSARVIFSLPEKNAFSLNRYADGCFLSADCAGGFEETGRSDALWARAARARRFLSRKLLGSMEQPYAGMAAAMTVGERAYLDGGIRDDLRRAGLSHIIVVSGMHLSAVSGLLYAALRRVLRRRAAGAAAMLSVLGFMLLMGFTPSVTRAGIAMLLLYGAAMIGRKSDGFTSLGAAALALCAANPYAAADIGLLLSFLATLSVLCVLEAKRRWEWGRETPKGRFRRFVRRLLWTAAIPAGAAVSTLPVLIAIGEGVSLLSVCSSLLVLPVLPLAVCAGFGTALAACAGHLGFIQTAASVLCTALMRWIEAVARWTASFSGLFVHVSGAFALCVSVLVCALIWAAWHWRVRARAAVPAILGFAALCALLYAALDTGVVHVELAGSGAYPAVVVMEGLHTAVIYRGGAASAEQVWETLGKYNRTGVDLLIDLREDGDTALLAETLRAKESVHVAAQVINHAVYAPFGDVLLYVRHQARGDLVCIEIRGVRIGTARGHTDWAELPAIDCYIDGFTAPQGVRCSAVIEPRARRCEWLEDEQTRVYGRAALTVRAGYSWTIQEVDHAFEWIGP